MRLNDHIARVSNEDSSSVDVEIKDEAAIAAEPEEIEAIAAELVEADAPAKSDVDPIQEYQDIQFSLEQFQGQLNAAKQRGGLRPEEAALIGTQLRFFQKRLGISDKLGLEDFDCDTRDEALVVSQEGVAKTGKAIFAKLIELLQNAISILKQTIQRQVANSAKIQNVANYIKAKSKDWRGKVATVPLEGTLLSPADFPGGLQELSKFVVNRLDLCLVNFERDIKATGQSIQSLLRSEFNEDDLNDACRIWETSHPFNVLRQSGQGAQLAERISLVVSTNDTSLYRGLTTNVTIFADDGKEGLTLSLQAVELTRLAETNAFLDTKLRDVGERYEDTLVTLNKFIARLNVGELGNVDPAKLATIRQIFLSISTQLSHQFGRVYTKCDQLNRNYSVILGRAAAQLEKSTGAEAPA